MPKNLLISLEGISGTGKSYLLKHFQEQMPEHLYLEELSDRRPGSMDHKIIDALRTDDNDFFSGGNPLTETLLLLALKTFDYESNLKAKLDQGRIVCEDRSIDTIAVYQGIIATQGDTRLALARALEIYKQATFWRPSPDLTFLIEDDFDLCLERAEKRRQQKYSEKERQILRNAYDLYPQYARSFQDRIVMVDRRKSDLEAVVGLFTDKIDEFLNKK